MILVFILVALNIVVISSIYLKSKGNLHKRPIRDSEQIKEDRIQEIFGFDETQFNHFKESKEKHRLGVKALDDKLAGLSQDYYLSKGEQNDSLINEILNVSKEIYIKNKAHINELKEICNDEQERHLNGFVDRLLRGNKDRRRPPRRPNN